MSIVLKHATIYTGEKVIYDGYLRFSSKIEAVGSIIEYRAQPEDDIYYISNKIVVPGFIDVHSHGGYGFDFMDGNTDQINKIVNNTIKEGVTTIFSTTMTQSTENISHAIEEIAKVSSKNQLIQGLHLEGPFIDDIYKGAQSVQYIKDPDVELLAYWNDLSGNRIRLITYAPEKNNAAKFEDYCLANNIVISVGHSNATRKQLLSSRATHVTHLYNAQREFKHREPGVTGHAMLEDNMFVELICDGFHVVPDMIKLAYKQKGPHRIELVTDAMRAKGIPEGESELGGQKVIVKDKQVRLETGNLAGSVLRFDDAFRNVIDFTGCGIEEAVLMSSVNQSLEFGLTNKGTLIVGKDADINIFDRALNLETTYSYGRRF